MWRRRAAGEADTTAPHLDDEDAVRVLGSRRGVDYGRWTGGPADTLRIDFELGWAGWREMRGNPEFRAMLERAGRQWSHRIADTWAAWDRPVGDLKGWLASTDPAIEVRVGARGETSARLEIDIRDDVLTGEFAGRGRTGVLTPGESWEPRFGSIVMDQEHLRDATDASLYRVLVHEIGHVLGAWEGDDTTQRHAPYTNPEAGTWSGPQVIAVHGGPAPFQDDSDPYTSVDGERDPGASRFDFSHSGVCTSIMAYCNRNTVPRPFAPHAIDFAFLEDLGMTVTEETDRPETYGLAGWTDYAGFSLSVSRDLQVELAHPEPRYDRAAGRWRHALDVTDVLHVGADAFGHRTTGGLARSFSTHSARGTVRYAGGLLGTALDLARLPPVTGDASLAVDLGTLDGTASFTSLQVHDGGTPAVFAGGALHYPFEVSSNDLVGTETDSTFRARFYGPNHEDVAGALHDPGAGLLASFGGTFDDRSSREEVVASADYMLGRARQRGRQIGPEDRWYRYRCESDSTCESRYTDMGEWMDWATVTRNDVLAATAGWNWRSSSSLVEDGRIARIARQSTATQSGLREHHVVDGYAGTMEHAAFGVGFEATSDLRADLIGTPLDRYGVWTGIQGARSGSSPDETARWSGRMLGYQHGIDSDEDAFVEGHATVAFFLPENRLSLEFSDIASRDGRRKLCDIRFRNLQPAADGTFEGDGMAGDLQGAFFGPSHQEVAGLFDHDATDLVGSFGAGRVPDIATPAELDVRAALRRSVDEEGMRHVGTGIAPPVDVLAERRDFHGVAVSSGEVQDGTSAERVVEYLQVQAGGALSGTGELSIVANRTPGLATFRDRPTIRLAAGANDELAAYVERAVHLVNSALPDENLIEFGETAAPPRAALEDVPDGQILVHFTSSPDHPNATRSFGWSWYAKFNNEAQRRELVRMRAAHLWLNSDAILNTAKVWNAETREWEVQELESPVVETGTVRKHYSEESVFAGVLQTLVRSLGLTAKVDHSRFEGSIVQDSSRPRTWHLPTIDRDALLAAYTRFEAGTQPEDLSVESLGPWDDTSFHVRGDLGIPGGEFSFGVGSRNGLVHPWAFGPEPLAALENNTALAGTVVWNGGLLGITPSEEAVAGGARLSVGLATLDGRLDFTGLEHWETGTAPGAAGTGTTWDDGDLGYSISVQGNAFVRTGGDDGDLTGAFLGRAHEGMGGTLERSDLTAAFGGTRH